MEIEGTRRVLKVRIWDGKKFHYPEATKDEANHYLQFGSEGFWLYNEQGKMITASEVGGICEEFTGLPDKNGKEIYEGDILKVRVFENLGSELGHPNADELEGFSLEEMKGKLKDEYVSEVVWDEGCFILNEDENCAMFLGACMGDMRCSYPIFETEVIGNIHEHPELL